MKAAKVYNRFSPKFLEVKISKIPDSGKGLFTKVFIPKGTLIIEYKGKITSWENADHDDGNNSYIYYVDKTHVIDASKHFKNLARYANDAKGFSAFAGLKNNCCYSICENKKVFIKAIKNIAAHSEILVNYGKEYWDTQRKYKEENADN